MYETSTFLQYSLVGLRGKGIRWGKKEERSVQEERRPEAVVGVLQQGAHTTPGAQAGGRRIVEFSAFMMAGVRTPTRTP